MVAGKAAPDDHLHSAGEQYTMAPLTVQSSTLPALLAKLVDKDPNCRRTSLEAIKELIHSELVSIDDLLATLTCKKSRHYLLSSSSDQSSHSLLAQSSALLLAEVAISATRKQRKLSLPHISSTVKIMVSWFPLDMGAPPSQSGSQLHQTCAKLICSLAENAATITFFDSSRYSPSSSAINNSDSAELNDITSSITSCNSEEDPFHEQAQQCALVMESLCRPLISALCNKVEPISRGATTCLEALVSMESWRFASLSLGEELCLRAFSAMQERTALSASIVQMNLLRSLAKKNHESLGCFSAGLLKKAVEVLLKSGAWQQRVAAARLIECLLSLGGQGTAIMESKQGKQAIEALEKCRLDKVAMVRSAVGEALRIFKHQRLDRGSTALPASPSLTTSLPSSSMKAPKAEYRKRRRKKPLGPYDQKQQEAFSSPLIRTDPFSAGSHDRWINSTTSWSSSESVNSSVDLKCPRRKVPRTGRWSDQMDSTYKTIGRVADRCIDVNTSSPALSSISSRSSSATLACPSFRSSLYNPTDKSSPVLPSLEEETSKNERPHNLMEPISSIDIDEGRGMLEKSSSCSSGLEDACLEGSDTAADDDAEGANGEDRVSSSTSSNIHENPIAQLAESLGGVELAEACESGSSNPLDDVLSATPMSLLQPKLEHIRLHYSDTGEGMRGSEHLCCSAWNVWNNPIATDDSELDSPRPTVSDSYSIIYCDDGDDDKDALIVHGRQPVDSPEHVRQHQDGDDFQERSQEVCSQHENNGGGGCVDHVSGECWHQGCDKQISPEVSQDCTTDDECRVDSDCRALTLLHVESIQCISDIANSTVCSLSEDDSASHPTKNYLEASSADYDTNVPAFKQRLNECGESQEDDEGHASVEQNLSACQPGPERYYDASGHLLLQESIDGRSSLLKEHVVRVPTHEAGMSLTTTSDYQQAIENMCQAVNEEDHMSTELQRCYRADMPQPHTPTDEHEGVDDNLDEFACSNGTNKALYNDRGRDSFRDECPLRDHELKGSITHTKDMQVPESAIAGEASLACSKPKKGEPAEESSVISVLGWLRKWYVVKKWRLLFSWWPPSPFGVLLLSFTIPLAIVSIVRICDTKEGDTDFLVPT